MYTLSSLAGIVQNPSGTVPLLSNDSIYSTIVRAIRSYIDQEISLGMLVDVNTKIQLFSGFRENDARIETALRSVGSLKNYLHAEDSNRSSINKLLSEILNSSKK